MIGTLVGGYRVVTEMGSGPSGVVYYAEHPVIGRRAVIKLLAPEAIRDRERLDSYLTRLKIIASIRHPNIIDVLDVGGTEPGAPATYIVMEMMEGESLGERLEREGVLSPEAAARIVAQVATAVGAAHDRGLVHAALKPENIYVTNNVDYPDFVKVLDFGSAILRDAQTITKAQHYLSPEQRAGDEPDPEVDVYALGIIACEMMCGQAPQLTPVAGPNGETQVRSVAPAALRGIAPALCAVIEQATASEPGDRYPSLREFRKGMERAIVEPHVPAERSAIAPSSGTLLPVAPPVIEPAHVERAQAKKVGRALSDIILRRVHENRLMLPTMPLIALKCLDVLRNANASFAEVAKVIEQDPMIATRVLRMVNSAAYSRRHVVTSLEAAVSQIGVKPMRVLLVELAAHQVFASRSAGIRTSFKQIWEHCLAVGMLSRDLCARLKSRVDPDVAYLGGLLHDIGKPIVAALLLEAERQLIEELDAPWMTETLWQKTVAESHRRVGAAVATAWNLPAAVADAIENCDEYDRAAGRNSCGNLVRFANALTKREGIYLGEVSGDELVGTILQGRRVLETDEATEAALIATLRDRTAAVTSGRPPRPRDTRGGVRARSS